MNKPLKLNTADKGILDKEATYQQVMQTMLPGLAPDQVYEMSGANLSKLIYDVVYFAHGNGRARERQVSASPLNFGKVK